MFEHVTTLRVRYSETDKMGIVYHGNYAQYFEVARVEWLRNIGVSYKKMEDSGVMLPVINYQVKFIKPAHYDDILKIKTQLYEIPKKVRITFTYQVTNQNQDLISTAESTLVFLNAFRKPIRCPEYITKGLL